jgi:hypothetical protein
MYERSYHNRVLRQDAPTLVRDTKAKRFWRWKVVVRVVAVLFVLAGLVFLVRADAVQVKKIEVKGTAVIDPEDVSQGVRSDLEGNYLWILPRSSVFLINERHLASSVQKKFSRIETVSISRTNFHTLTVSLKEFEAVYLWCISVDKCYFMDKQGVVYSPAPVFSGTAYPKIITGAPLETLPFQAMTLADVTRFGSLEKGLSQINIVPTLFKNISEREMSIEFLHNKRTATLRIDPTVDTDTTLEYVYSGIRAEPLASLFRNQEKVLLYLDVRFSNKVVYKFEQ